MTKLYLYSSSNTCPCIEIVSDGLSEQQRKNLGDDGCTMLTGSLLVISEDYSLLKSYTPKDLTFWRIMNYEANGVVSDKIDLVNSCDYINHRVLSKDNKIENLTWRKK